MEINAEIFILWYPPRVKPPNTATSPPRIITAIVAICKLFFHSRAWWVVWCKYLVSLTLLNYKVGGRGAFLIEGMAAPTCLP